MVERQHILNLSWNTVDDGIQSLAYQLKPHKPKLIVGIARGGLTPATMLSHALKTPLAIITASTYKGARRTPKQITTLEGWESKYEDPNVWFVDDIVDSGQTMDAITRRCRNAKTAALVTKLLIGGLTAHFAYVPQGVWVKFPWETE